MPATPAKPLYFENVRAPIWFYFVLSTPLGIVLGLMTGVAITGSISGGEAIAFYIGMSLVALIVVLFLVNFTNLTITVTGGAIEFAFGLFRKRLPLSQVKAVEAATYRWVEYGGWGIRVAMKGKRAWSVPGAKRGAAIRVDERGKDRLYFISSYQPEALVDSIKPALTGATAPVARATAAPSE